MLTQARKQEASNKARLARFMDREQDDGLLDSEESLEDWRCWVGRIVLVGIRLDGFYSQGVGRQ
jgi:hypothetical protein